MSDNTDRIARAWWNQDRVLLKKIAPGWTMPAWSRAPAWRKRPYVTRARGMDDAIRSFFAAEGRAP